MSKKKRQQIQTDALGSPVVTMGITSQREWLRVVASYIDQFKVDPLYTPKQKQRAVRAIRSIGRHAVVLDKFDIEVALF